MENTFKGKYELNGKVAIVTGGGTGIGLGITKSLVSQGAKAVITGRRDEPLRNAEKELGGSVLGITADLSLPGEAMKVVQFTKDKFGGVNILVNNAGTAIPKPFLDTNHEDYDLQYKINVNGLIGVTREVAKELAQNGGGAIVNISSTVAQSPTPGLSIYASSKAAVEQFSRTLAVELGPAGIRVNSVAPGTTETDLYRSAGGDDPAVGSQMIQMTPLGRLGKPEDIARAVTWLVSDEASWITGQVVQSSGGFML